MTIFAAGTGMRLALSRFELEESADGLSGFLFKTITWVGGSSCPDNRRDQNPTISPFSTLFDSLCVGRVLRAFEIAGTGLTRCRSRVLLTTDGPLLVPLRERLRANTEPRADEPDLLDLPDLLEGVRVRSPSFRARARLRLRSRRRRLE